MNETQSALGWQVDYTELKHMLKALGDVARLNLVHVLSAEGEVTVTDLVQALLISQPLVSWHLTILRRAGLVQTRRQGRLVYCSLNRERYQLCMRMLGEVIGEAPPRLPTPTPVSDGTGPADARPPKPPAPARSQTPTKR
ncbi:MAG TPA: metalloregulator ArsR/SmtB family transcription factor [Ktedonobacterales bacterium]